MVSQVRFLVIFAFSAVKDSGLWQLTFAISILGVYERRLLPIRGCEGQGGQEGNRQGRGG